MTLDRQAWRKFQADGEINDEIIRYIDDNGVGRTTPYINKLCENLINWIAKFITKDEWKFIYDGLPKSTQLFNYEKDIIRFYYEQNPFYREKDHIKKEDLEKYKKLVLDGVPAEWPIVKKVDKRPSLESVELKDEIQEEIGKFRHHNDCVLSAALSEFHKGGKYCPCNIDPKLIFREAGPRKIVCKPTSNPLRIGILVSGGIAPGINALIDGITRRHYFYAKELGYEEDLIEILGLINGFESLKAGGSIDARILYPTEKEARNNVSNKQVLITSEITNEGGSAIGTSRYETLVDEDPIKRDGELKSIVNRLRLDGYRILYIIGGEGSMKAALSIQEVAQKSIIEENHTDWDLNVVGIPKTMDNDILWVWQTFGFMSAVEKAREFVEYLFLETSSNPRWGIVQLFGSNSGFVVSHAVVACKSGICDLALIPEMDYKIEYVINYIKDSGKDNGLIVMAETAVPDDISDFIKKQEDGHGLVVRPKGMENEENQKSEENEENQTILTPQEVDAIEKHFEKNSSKLDCHVDDNLRSGIVKVLSWAISNVAEKKVLINEPRHLLRSLPPSTIDIINASRLGSLAVDNAVGGYYGFMISQWLTEFCLVPLQLVVLGRKRIPKDGIFFKSVIKKTGQPKKLSDKKLEK